MEKEIVSSKKVERPPEFKWYGSYGFLPIHHPGCKPVPYDGNYFQNYERLARTPQGRIITQLRKDLVERWTLPRRDHIILDVGIGSGAFVKKMQEGGWTVYGTDINPDGVHWLREHNFHWETQSEKTDVPTILTFWDSLEHIEFPGSIFVGHYPDWIFLSMPIYHNYEHVFRSKHYKPGEHCWYFTEAGLREYMQQWGYILVELNALEIIKGGREDVWSFAFKKQP